MVNAAVVTAAPALYVGSLRHRRHEPRAHEFRYALFMVLLDIDRLPEAMAVSRLTGYNGRRWAAFHERDHIGEPSRPLRDALDVGPKIDLWKMRYRYAKTNQRLRFAAQRGYDTYLKANRVEKGVESYDAVVQLILGTAVDDAGYPRRR